MTDQNDRKNFQDLLFESIVPKVEMISLALVGLGILFKILSLEGTTEIFMIALSTYAAVCYLRGFEKTELQGWFNKMITKFSGISSAVLVIGTLFLTLNLPGHIDMLTIGVPSFSIAFLVIIFKHVNSASAEYKKMLDGNIKTILVVGLVFLATYYLQF